MGCLAGRAVSLALVLVAGLASAACSDGGGTPEEGAEVARQASATSVATTGAPAAAATTPTTVASTVAAPTTAAAPTFAVEAFPVPAGSAPHDVSPAAGGGVWFTAQASGQLGLLDPATGQSRMIDLGEGSRPHGVITGPDGAAWVTDGGLDAILRVDEASGAITSYPLPEQAAGADLNTAVFGADGVLWFTGQAGWYGKVDAAGAVSVFAAPGGRGPYGIAATPDGAIYYASLAGSHLGRIDPATGEATVLTPPVPEQGSRRVWADSRGRLWVTGWSSGDLFLHDPATGEWRSWRLPGEGPQPYAVFVDATDAVWVSDFGANALVRFDPATEAFSSLPLPSPDGQVRQLHGRGGEVWGAESSADQLVVVRRSP